MAAPQSRISGALDRRLKTADVPPSGLTVELAADAGERARLAEALELQGIASLALTAKLERTAEGRLTVDGTLTARVTRICVVSLEPFEVELTIPVERVFAPAGPASTVRHELVLDPDAPIEDALAGDGSFGVLDIAAEELSLALDPFPRKPDAVLEVAADEVPPEENPFAVLAKLKGEAPPET